MCYLQVPEIKISMWAVTAAQEGVGKSCAVCGPQCRDGSVRAAQARSTGCRPAPFTVLPAPPPRLMLASHPHTQVTRGERPVVFKWTQVQLPM